MDAEPAPDAEADAEPAPEDAEAEEAPEGVAEGDEPEATQGDDAPEPEPEPVDATPVDIFDAAARGTSPRSTARSSRRESTSTFPIRDPARRR